MITFKGRVEGNKFIIEDINELTATPEEQRRLDSITSKADVIVDKDDQFMLILEV